MGCLRPEVSGATVTEGWSVLLPDGFVVCDEFASPKFNGPLQTWINLEIEWMKVANCSMDRDDMKEFSSPREAIFCNGGPIARAIVTMMSWRTNDWIGTPENSWQNSLPFARAVVRNCHLIHSSWQRPQSH